MPLMLHDNEIELTSCFARADAKTLARTHAGEYVRFVHDLSRLVQLKQKRKSRPVSRAGFGVPQHKLSPKATSTTASNASHTSTNLVHTRAPFPSPPQSPLVVPFTPHVQKSLQRAASQDLKNADQCDTSFSTGSLGAARRAVGAACFAVDRVVRGANRNAFCLVRPPGHHAGTRGLLEGSSSCGFCIFNNVAAAALHALYEYGASAYATRVHNWHAARRLHVSACSKNTSGAANSDVVSDAAVAKTKAAEVALAEEISAMPIIKRVAIIDLDVHHGNGTEEIMRRHAREADAARAYAIAAAVKSNDCEALAKAQQMPSSRSLFFFSVHLFDSPPSEAYEFYPGTGSHDATDMNIMNVPVVPLWRVSREQQAAQKSRLLRRATAVARRAKNANKVRTKDARVRAQARFPSTAAIKASTSTAAKPVEAALATESAAPSSESDNAHKVPKSKRARTASNASSENAHTIGEQDTQSGHRNTRKRRRDPDDAESAADDADEPIIRTSTRRSKPSAKAKEKAELDAKVAAKAGWVVNEPGKGKSRVGSKSKGNGATHTAGGDTVASGSGSSVSGVGMEDWASAFSDDDDEALLWNTTDTTAGVNVNTAIPVGGRLAWRRAIALRLLPALSAFQPDLILLSSGFDGASGDVGNARHGMSPRTRAGGLDLLPGDFCWATRRVMRLASTLESCAGRVVSVLEGGYGSLPRSRSTAPATRKRARAAAASNDDNTVADVTAEDEKSMNRQQLAANAVCHICTLVDPQW